MRPRVLVLTMAVLALLAASCADSGSVEADPGSPAPNADAPEIRAYLALCSVGTAASAQDLATAEATFHDEVHETLHHLADEVEAEDREVAAALLQAKSTVEADFAEEAPDPSTVSDHVAALLSAMGDALEGVGLVAPDCTEGSSRATSTTMAG